MRGKFKGGLAEALGVGVLIAGLAAGPGQAATPKPVADKVMPMVVPEGAYLYFVFGNCPPDKEKAFATWWDGHMGAIAQLPGFVSAQRFVSQSRPGRPDPHFRQMAVYLIKGDPEAVLGEIGPAIKAGKVTPSDRTLLVEMELSIYTPARPTIVNLSEAQPN